MDILKIRRRAAKQSEVIAAKDVQPRPTSSIPSSVVTPLAVAEFDSLASHRIESSTRFNSASEGRVELSPDQSDTPATALQRPAPPPSAPVDPLRDFLASYDSGTVAVEDDESGADVETDQQRFLAFDLAGEGYAASIMDVREILKVVSLTEVPRAPRDVLGVLSKRGLVMPVVDLAATLGLRTASRTSSKDQRVLMVGDGKRICGLRVDAVSEVVRLSQEAIESVPASLGQRNAHMLLGLGRVGERILIILDIPAVLDAFAVAMGQEPTQREEVA